jgi:hypothetical protein
MDDARSKKVQELVFALVADSNQGWLSLQKFFLQEPVDQSLNRPWKVISWLLGLRHSMETLSVVKS